MLKHQESIHNLSIVLVGQFNPAIISPDWLALKKLIRESESEAAQIKIIHPEVSQFSLSFLEIQVTKDKFQLNCNNAADFILARDLAASIFTYLKETPVNGIGLNHIVHFALPNKEAYIKFGDWLAPHKIWSELLKNPGLLELKIIEEVGEEDYLKSHVMINPSEKIHPFGVRFQLNYHIELTKVKNMAIATAIIEHWDKSANKFDHIYKKVLKSFENE